MDMGVESSCEVVDHHISGILDGGCAARLSHGLKEECRALMESHGPIGLLDHGFD